MNTAEVINKPIIEELADIRLDALRMMRVYEDMINDKLREIRFMDQNQIYCTADRDSSVMFVLTKNDDGTVSMSAVPK